MLPHPAGSDEYEAQRLTHFAPILFVDV
jgi:hypothetical protein